MNVVTISREFGSGGREFGKRLAERLGYVYYDREIEENIAKRMDMDPGYVAQAIEHGTFPNIPLHFGRTLGSVQVLRQKVDILVEKQKVLKEIASASNCVIVGRAADVILGEYKPFRIFVYADMAYKIERCQKYGETGKAQSPRDLEKAIKKIDSGRSQYHKLFMDIEWGRKENYELCVNTTGLTMNKIVLPIAEYVKNWFEEKKR